MLLTEKPSVCVCIRVHVSVCIYWFYYGAVSTQLQFDTHLCHILGSLSSFRATENSKHSFYPTLRCPTTPPPMHSRRRIGAATPRAPRDHTPGRTPNAAARKKINSPVDDCFALLHGQLYISDLMHSISRATGEGFPWFWRNTGPRFSQHLWTADGA